MFKDKMKTVRMLGVMAIALAMFCGGAFLMGGGDSDADTITIGGVPYTTSDITIAPDYKWIYPVDFDEGLDDAVVAVYPEETTDAIESKVSIVDKEVTVDFTGVATGTYYLVLKAYHAPSEQTAYQAIKFTVVSGIAITPTGTLTKNFVVDEDGTDAYTFDIVTKYGTINTSTITVDGEAVDPSKLEATHDDVNYVEGQKYTVTVDADTTTAGKKTITINASTALGEPGESISTYIVYDKIKVQNVTVRAYSDGTTTWSLAPEQTNSSEDAKVEVLASYMHIDKPELENYRTNGTSILTRTGAPSSAITMTYVIEVVTTNMVGHEQQKDYANLYVYDEPEFTLADHSETVFPKYTQKSVSFVPSTSTTTQSWTITPETGVTFADGVATVNKDSVAGTYNVSVTTAAGQTRSATLTIASEADITISGKAPGESDTFKEGKATLGPVVSTLESGITRDYGFKADGAVGEVTWTITSELPAGVNATIDENGVLHLQSASKQDKFTLTIHAETASGNFDNYDIEVTFYNVLSFNEPPTTGCYAFAANADP